MGFTDMRWWTDSGVRNDLGEGWGQEVHLVGCELQGRKAGSKIIVSGERDGSFWRRARAVSKNKHRGVKCFVATTL